MSKLQLITTLFILILTSSCGVTPISNYSNSSQPKVELTEEEIERQKILEHYRLMRAKQWDTINTKKIYYRMPKKVVITPKKEEPPKIKYVDVGEQNVEIEQNIVYFCMNRKKFQNFENENECLTFTKNIQDECSMEFEAGDARLTQCIKSRLKY